jgi:hypothetical protein
MVTGGHALTESLFTSRSNYSRPPVNLIYLLAASAATRWGAPVPYNRPLIKILVAAAADLWLLAAATNGQPLDSTAIRWINNFENMNFMMY